MNEITIKKTESVLAASLRRRFHKDFFDEELEEMWSKVNASIEKHKIKKSVPCLMIYHTGWWNFADDEKELSNALVAILKHNNYSVDAVYDGKEALEYGLAENYDVIILDIMMPKMDGIEVLENLRKEGIKVTEELDKIKVNTIAKNVAQKIVAAFPELEFKLGEVFIKLSQLKMYYAEVPKGFSEANYFYKNTSIYFNQEVPIEKIENYATSFDGHLSF